MHQLTTVYIIFIAAVYLLFIFTPFKYRAFFLLVSSLGYYIYIEPKLYFIIFAMVVQTYLDGIIIGKTQNVFKRKLWLIIYVLSIILIYFPFKYYHTFNYLKETFGFGSLHSYVLPIGISFFTFKSMSYVFDVYYKKIQAEFDFIKCALFVSFFPRLICGPIDRFQKFVPQIDIPFSQTRKNLIVSFSFLYSGVFKKYILADNIVSFALAYSNPSKLSGAEWLFISIITRYHVFLDFSGYTDIALGIGKLFGYDFTDNFKRPFAAATIDEFWRRWHITLSTWIRDYIFYPLVTGAKSTSAIYICLIASFTFLGIWHGDSLNFLIYGLVNGTAIVLTLILRKFINKNSHFSFLRFFAWSFTFIFFISLPSVFLRSENIHETLNIFQIIFASGHFWELSETGLFIFSKIKIFLPMILAYEILSYLNSKKLLLDYFEREKLYIKLLVAILLITLFFTFYNVNSISVPYIYERF